MANIVEKLITNSIHTAFIKLAAVEQAHRARPFGIGAMR